MAWNDPFVTLVEKTVDELGVFLQNQGDLAIHEIARTQEVCRDFCNFICKDIHKATKKDYTVYLQLHAMTPEDEDAYAIMLSNIRSYCEESMPEFQEPEPAPAVPHTRKRAATNNMSLSEQELRDMFTTADTPKSNDDLTEGRQRKATNAFSFSENELKGLFMSNHENEPKPSTPAKPKVQQQNEPHSISFTFPQDELNNQANSTKATPQNPQKSINPDSTPLPPSSKSISLRVNKKEFSMDSLLEDELNIAAISGSSTRNSYSGLIANAQNAADTAAPNSKATKKPILDEPKPYAHAQRNSFADLFATSANSPGDSANPATFNIRTDESFAINMDQVAPDSNVQAPNDLTRGVKGVEYDFSQSNIRKMRKFEKKKSSLESENNLNPIDSSLLKSFRPYLFDTKYTIDMPLPDPNAMVECKPSTISMYIIPCAPAAFLLLLSALFFTFLDILGIVFLILAFIAIAIALPSILPAQQQTPQATLASYLKAKNGRCYGKAQSLLAVSKNASDTEIDLHKLWAPENKWPKAILNRFETPKIPELRNVSGTDIQNAHLFLHADEQTYWLIPFIRLDNKWYITDPQMTPKNIHH